MRKGTKLTRGQDATIRLGKVDRDAGGGRAAVEVKRRLHGVLDGKTGDGRTSLDENLHGVSWWVSC